MRSGEGTEKDPSQGRWRGRNRVLVVAGIAVLVLGAGLGAATLVKSPEQVAAETRAPEPSPITVEVVHKVLAETVVFRGGFAPASSILFTPTSAATLGGGEPVTQNLVVSRLWSKQGDTVRAGKVLLEVCDRPVFVLKGTVPAFRDLAEGDVGQDVLRLQKGLAEAGYSSGDRSGIFGGGTASAVRRFYRDIGYPVVTQVDTGAPAQSSPSASPGRVSAPEKDVEKVTVPMSEVMFVPKLPARVNQFPRVRGAKVTEPLVGLSGGGLVLTGRLGPDRLSTVRTGMRVTVTSDSGETATGRIVSIGKLVKPSASSGQTDEEDAEQSVSDVPYHPVEISPDRRWKNDWNGQDVQLTVTKAATESKVLAVPQAALTSGADGVTSVTVMDANGAQRRVEVRAGISADGLVAVTAVQGALHEGDRVVVGS